MGKSNLLTSLSLDIETFKAHLKRISKEDYKVHQLDKDLLLGKTRQLYDNILQIEVAGEEKIEPKKVVEKTVEREEILMEVEKKPVVEIRPPKKEIVEEKPKVEEKTEVEEKDKNIDAKPQPEPKSKPQPKPESAYDLFSPSTNTVSDKFITTEDKSIASKLKQNKLDDLRNAIGINEKFLFINELFNGDMGKYNKAIDEINSMQSKAGTDTYIMELKIEKQWDVESDAFIKFKELADRKFN